MMTKLRNIRVMDVSELQIAIEKILALEREITDFLEDAQEGSFKECLLEREEQLGSVNSFLGEIIDNLKKGVVLDSSTICDDCIWLEDKYANNGYPCAYCQRNEKQVYGPNHFEYGDHHEIKSQEEIEKEVCEDCRWSVENPEFEVDGCYQCIRGGIVGKEDPTAKDNFTPYNPPKEE